MASRRSKSKPLASQTSVEEDYDDEEDLYEGLEDDDDDDSDDQLHNASSSNMNNNNHNQSIINRNNNNINRANRNDIFQDDDDDLDEDDDDDDDDALVAYIENNINKKEDEDAMVMMMQLSITSTQAPTSTASRRSTRLQSDRVRGLRRHHHRHHHGQHHQQQHQQQQPQQQPLPIGRAQAAASSRGITTTNMTSSLSMDGDGKSHHVTSTFSLEDDSKILTMGETTTSNNSGGIQGRTGLLISTSSQSQSHSSANTSNHSHRHDHNHRSTPSRRTTPSQSRGAVPARFSSPRHRNHRRRRNNGNSNSKTTIGSTETPTVTTAAMAASQFLTEATTRFLENVSAATATATAQSPARFAPLPSAGTNTTEGGPSTTTVTSRSRSSADDDDDDDDDETDAYHDDAYDDADDEQETTGASESLYSSVNPTFSPAQTLSPSETSTAFLSRDVDDEDPSQDDDEDDDEDNTSGASETSDPFANTSQNDEGEGEPTEDDYTDGSISVQPAGHQLVITVVDGNPQGSDQQSQQDQTQQPQRRLPKRKIDVEALLAPPGSSHSKSSGSHDDHADATPARANNTKNNNGDSPMAASSPRAKRVPGGAAAKLIFVGPEQDDDNDDDDHDDHRGGSDHYDDDTSRNRNDADHNAYPSQAVPRKSRFKSPYLRSLTNPDLATSPRSSHSHTTSGRPSQHSNSTHPPSVTTTNELEKANEIDQARQMAKEEFQKGSPTNRRYYQQPQVSAQNEQQQQPNATVGEDDGTSTAFGTAMQDASSSGLLPATSSSTPKVALVAPAPSFLNKREIFHETPEAAVLALLTPKYPTSVADGHSVTADTASVFSHRSVGVAHPTPSSSVFVSSKSMAGNNFSHSMAMFHVGESRSYDAPHKKNVSVHLLTPEAERQLIEIQSRMHNPSPTLTDLLTAIATPDQAQQVQHDWGFMVRRKNACGALHVLTMSQHNRVRIAWTLGVLPALTSVLADSEVMMTKANNSSLTDGIGITTATSSSITNVQERRIRQEYEAGRNRAIATLLNLAMPKENRIAVFHTPYLVQSVLTVILEHPPAGLARKGCCTILAFLAKSPENRLLMVQVPHFIDAVVIVLSPLPPRMDIPTTHGGAGTMMSSRLPLSSPVPLRKLGQLNKQGNVRDNNNNKNKINKKQGTKHKEMIANNPSKGYPWSSDEDGLERDDDDESDDDDDTGSESDDASHVKSKERSMRQGRARSQSDDNDDDQCGGGGGGGGKDNENSETTPRVEGSRSPMELTGYDDTADEMLREARQNVFAMLGHLVKEKDNAYHFARDANLILVMVSISQYHESHSHVHAVKFLANLTRHRHNTNILVLKHRGVVSALVHATQSDDDDARLFACYALQNMAQDKSCRQELAGTNHLLLALCRRARQSQHPMERLAAISALKNLSDEPANLIPMTNTADCISTLMHVAHGREAGVTELMQYRACDALATLSHWLRKIATSGSHIGDVSSRYRSAGDVTVPGVGSGGVGHYKGTGSSTTMKTPAAVGLFVPSLRVVTWNQWQ